MAVATTELTSNFDNVDRTTFYSVASTSPAANSFLTLFYSSRHATTGPGMTPDNVFSGTWVESIAEQVDGISAVGAWTMQLGASPGTAGFNLNVDGGAACIGAVWCLLQTTGLDSSGTVVETQLGPTGTTSGTAAVTFSGAGSATDATLFWACHRGNDATTPEAGWTGATDRFGTAPNYGGRAQYRNDRGDLTATATFTSARWQAAGIQLKELVAGGPTPPMYVPIIRRNHLGLSIGRA